MSMFFCGSYGVHLAAVFANFPIVLCKSMCMHVIHIDAMHSLGSLTFQHQPGPPDAMITLLLFLSVYLKEISMVCS